MNPRSLYLGAAGVASLLALSLIPACGSSSNSSGFGSSSGSSNGGSSGSSGGSSSGSSSGSGNGTSSGTKLGDGDGGLTGEDGGACATATAQATATEQPVYMLFVLDGSGSMSENNKWTSVTGALTDIFNQWATTNDPGLAAGLIVFSDANDGTNDGPYPGSNDVAIAQVNSAQATKLEARYGGGDMPEGDTPTGEALGVTGSTYGTSTGGYHELATFTPSGALPTGGKKVLVLITDGVPNDTACGNTNYTTNACITYAATELASTSASGGPIETFVIGTGIFPSTDLTNFDPNFLGYLAKSGGSAPTGCTPNDNTSTTGLCYFNVDPSGSSTATQTAFENAITAIRGQVVTLSCTFKLDIGDSGTIDPSKVNVTVNGTTVPQDPTNGWTYDNPNDPTSITLHGTSCSEVTATATASVSIVLGCATVTSIQ
jgi:hypothetical protein